MTDCAGPNRAGFDPTAASQVSSISSVSIAAQIFYDRDIALSQHTVAENLGLYAASNDGRVNIQNIRSRPHDTVPGGSRQTI